MRGTRFAGHAVGSIDEDAELAFGGDEELEDMLAVIIPQVQGAERAFGGQRAAAAQTFGDGLDLLEAGGRADRFGLRAGDFEAVVVGGVVAGGGLDAAGGAQVIDGEIDERRVAHAQVDDGKPAGANAFDQGGDQGGGTGAHVAADEDGVSPRFERGAGSKPGRGGQELPGGAADLPGVLLIELVGVGGANVVSLEYLAEHDAPRISGDFLLPYLGE